jgi:hypothetical protein
MQDTIHHTITRIAPEDPAAVRRRDRVPKTYVGASQGRHGDAGDGARPKGRKTNRAGRGADRPRAVGSSSRLSPRAAANAAAYDGPPETQQVLRNGVRYGHRFSDTHWTILSLAYGPERLSDRDIAAGTNLGDPGTIRQAREVANHICWELIREYAPCCKKRDRIIAGNPRGEKLTDEEKRILLKHARPKQGRKHNVVVYPDARSRRQSPRRYEVSVDSGALNEFLGA